MLKKLVIAGVFIGAGVFLIKKILPQKEQTFELSEPDEVDINKAVEQKRRADEKKRMELQNKITLTGLHNLMMYGNQPRR